ncbi:MAG: TlpA disulfide reductase family protein [Myxococcota bacterium]
MNSRLASLLLAAAVAPACAGPSEPTPLAIGGERVASGPVTVITVPPAPESKPVTESRATYYRQAFPDAARFVEKSIPTAMIPTADKGNETYVVAQDPSGAAIGYLRDYTGPVTPFADCACSPMTLTFAFNADYSLETLLLPAPLEKKDHEQMTPEEQQRLIAIAKNPPEALAKNRSVNAVIDATTEATMPAFIDHVVKDAGLTTMRVVQLVRLTQRTLLRAPLAWDTQRLASILNAPATPMARAHALAEFLPTLENAETRRSVFRRMVDDYVEGLVGGAAPDEEVEARILPSEPGSPVPPTDVAHACYHLATRGLRLPLAERCLQRMSAAEPDGATQKALSHLAGTLKFLKGEHAAAAAVLLGAVDETVIAHDPVLALRLVQSLAATQRSSEACPIAMSLFREAPLLPGVKKGLRVCSRNNKVTKIINRLQAEQKQLLLTRRIEGNTAAPELSLEGPKLESIDLKLGVAGKVTVLVFFATWCPHCLEELPQINAFTESVRVLPAMRDRIRVIGIRTAVERESIPYEAFVEKMKPNFTVWFDATMSLAFGKFARAHGVSTTLPTVAVIDENGVTRYMLGSGRYRDLRRELTWAVEDTLGRDG